MSNDERDVILITIGITGQVSGTCRVSPGSSVLSARRETTDLEQMLTLLCEGGYVVDFRPLSNAEALVQWVLKAPLCNGQLSGEEISRLDDEHRQTALEMAPLLEGAFRSLALLLALDKPGTEPGPFDKVSAERIAGYWLDRGARIGRLVRGELHWSDGGVQTLLEEKQ
jgi:hypothetical protein